jgi:hypothetical protein
MLEQQHQVSSDDHQEASKTPHRVPPQQRRMKARCLAEKPLEQSLKTKNRKIKANWSEEKVSYCNISSLKANL